MPVYQKIVSIVFKAARKLLHAVTTWHYTPLAKCYLFLNGATVGSKLKVMGSLHLHVTRRGKLMLGECCSINSGKRFNLIGRQQTTTFWVDGKLVIGNNVGMSSTAIICQEEIIIGDNVTIGGNTVIYDTDFHALDPNERLDKGWDRSLARRKRVVIENGAFIGAHTTILKGVTIGSNSVIGAGSVVASSVPAGEIWAGNPAQFIRSL